MHIVINDEGTNLMLYCPDTVTDCRGIKMYYGITVGVSVTFGPTKL